MLNLVLGILSILLAIVGQKLLEAEQLPWSIASYAIALCLAVYAFRHQKFPDFYSRFIYVAPTQISPRSSWRWVPFLLLPIALSASVWGLTIFRDDYERPTGAWRLYIGSALLFLFATFLLQLLRPASADRRSHKFGTASFFKQVEWLLLLAIMGGATWIRLYRFDSFPLGTWYDEAVAVNLAQRILDDPTWRPLFPGTINVTGHYIYTVSRVLAVVEDPTLAVRLVSVVMGIGSVLAAYFAGREIFFLAQRSPDLPIKTAATTRPTITRPMNWAEPAKLTALLGLTLATYVAFSRWHVNFSRIGMYNIATPFFALLTIALLLRAIRRNNYFEYSLAGAAIGLGLCFYTAFFFFVAAIGLYLIYRILFERGFVREQWVGLTLMTLLIVMLVAPLAFFAQDKPDIYFARTNETSLLSNTPPEKQLNALLENGRKHLLMFNYRGDPNGRHNLPGKPMLDSIMGALLILGIGLCLRWIWRPTSILLLSWFGLALLGGILTLDFEAPQSLRSIAAQPAAYILAVLPLYFVGQLWLYPEKVRPYPKKTRAGSQKIENDSTKIRRANQSYSGWLGQPKRNHQTSSRVSTSSADSASVSGSASVPSPSWFSSWFSSPWLFGAVLALLLLPIIYENYTAYFDQQANDFASWNAFSTPETLAAGLFNQIYDTHQSQTEEEPAVDVYVISYFIDHPSFLLLGNESRRAKRLETTTQFPLSVPPDRDIYLLLNAETRSLFDETKRYYPNADYQEINPPFDGPPVVYQIHLTPDDIAGIQGLSSVYYGSNTWASDTVLTQKDLALRFEWPDEAPLPLPFSAEWAGTLNVVNFGPHGFYVQAPDLVEIYIDQARVWSASGNGAFAITLAKGNHRIRVRAVGAPGPFSLSWQTPVQDIALIPSQALYTPVVPANGLFGRYYANGEWTPPSAYTQIEPNFDLYFHIPLMERPYTIDWSGQIRLPEDGRYVFGLESIDESSLFLDGEEVLVADKRNTYTDTAIDLPRGLHDIALKFADRTDHTHINFYWQTPSGQREIVPADVLSPALEFYETTAVPHADRLIFHEIVPAAPTLLVPLMQGEYQFFEEDWLQISGITAGINGMIYVTDAPNNRVLALQTDGTLLYEISESASGIAVTDPTDLAVDSSGQLYILDASQTRILIFTAAGNYVRTLRTDPDIFERSRGLHVDFQDRIWVANTPRGRVIALDQDGEILLEVQLRPGQDSQPVDVAVGLDGKIFVTDASLQKLMRFSPEGRSERTWDLTPSITIAGPHLAVDKKGNIYLSDSSESKIAVLAADGQRTGEWELSGPSDMITTPVGIAVDAAGQIWYVDSASQTIGLINPNLFE